MDPSSERTPKRRRTAAERRAAVKRATTIATSRGGVVSGDELVAIGMHRREIRRHVDDGWLHDLQGDVFAVGHEALSERGWRSAAVLSGGPGAVLSYWTAAVLWALVGELPDANRIEVSTRRSDREGCRGSKIHCPSKLPPSDCTSRGGHRVTTLFRTLLDLARNADGSTLTGLVEAAHTRHEIDLTALARYAREHRGWPGARKLRQTAQSVAGPVRLRSDLEAMFRKLAQDAGLPDFETNVAFEGQELDVLFRNRNAALELDWFTYHGGRSAYRRDRRKSRSAGRAGIALMQVAGEDIEDDPDAVLADVLAWLVHHPVVAHPILGTRDHPLAPTPSPEAR